MFSPSNEDRATWASQAIDVFEHTRRELSVAGGSKDRNVSVMAQAAASAMADFVKTTVCDPDDALADLLANLWHYADSDEEDFDDLLEQSKALVAAATPDDGETEPSIPATVPYQDSNPHVEFLAALQFWARGQTPAAGVTDVFEDAYQRAVLNYEAETDDPAATEDKAPTKTTRRPR